MITSFDKTDELAAIFKEFGLKRPRKTMQYVIEDAVKDYAKKHGIKYDTLPVSEGEKVG